MVGNGRTRLVSCDEWVVEAPVLCSELAKVLGFMTKRRDEAFDSSRRRPEDAAMVATVVGDVYVRAEDDRIVVGFEVSRERE